MDIPNKDSGEHTRSVKIWLEPLSTPNLQMSSGEVVGAYGLVLRNYEGRKVCPRRRSEILVSLESQASAMTSTGSTRAAARVEVRDGLEASGIEMRI